MNGYTMITIVSLTSMLTVAHAVSSISAVVESSMLLGSPCRAEPNHGISLLMPVLYSILILDT